MVAFKPRDDETLYESWMRFKELERQCPHHEIPKWMIVQNFYTRVTPAIRNTIDSQAGGDFMRMTSEECYDLLEKIAHNTHLWGNPRALEPKKAGIYELDSVSYMNARFDQLTQLLSDFCTKATTSTPTTMQQVAFTDGTQSCGVDYSSYGDDYLQEQAAYAGGHQQKPMGNSYSNVNNSTWRPQATFAQQGQSSNYAHNQQYVQQNRPQFQPQFQPTRQPQPGYQARAQQFLPPHEPKPTLESMMEKFFAEQSKMNSKLEEEMQHVRQTMDQLQVHNRMLETQLAQQASSSGSNSYGKLPSQPQNPHEQCKVVTLRSGKKVGQESENKREEKESTK
ncbi:hypothetical protein P3X46_012704 [Hevea brasiliensis]|uniref:Retrotransposon gag domain-containing protein n=1 Tax=Hevea brasiliensis TaxID=3981 RepID=A0ABQ9MF40_HEVBR|nr:hypothetical protein P3X46_012704 [Hevea brasiliensis]